MQITRYNETSEDARATTLKHSIGSADTLVGVAFSHPSGVIRLNDFTKFTHFTASFEGETYIYKVNGFRAINNGVCEISYSLDFLKDWWSKHNWSNLNGTVVARSTVLSDWSAYIPDTEFLPNGKSSTTVTSVYSSTDWDITNGWIVAVIKYPYNDMGGGTRSPYVACPMSMTDFRAFAALMLGGNGSAMYKQLHKIYYCPFGELISSSFRDNTVPISFIKTTTQTEGSWIETKVTKAENSAFDAGGATISIGGVAVGPITAEPIKRSSGSRIMAHMALNTIAVNDFRDTEYTKYSLYIPYYGVVDVPIRELTNYADGTADLSIDYILNPYEGLVSFRWSALGGISYDYRPLPTIDIANGDVALNVINTNEKFMAQQTAGVAGMAASIFSVPVVQNLGASVSESGDYLGDITSINEGGRTRGLLASFGLAANELNTKATVEAIARGGQGYGGGGNGWSSYNDNRFKLHKTRITATDYLDKCAEVGYPCNRYYTKITPVTGNRYVLDTSKLRVNGNDWYKNGVVAALGGDYIYYNK